jgi:hypothetical protein
MNRRPVRESGGEIRFVRLNRRYFGVAARHGHVL